MTQDKRVSIVLPVYNGASYVSDSINSIIDQTYKNWELIVVNDCSTDDTLKICERLSQKDDRISVVSNKTNLKLPNSLNVGFALATGYYYTWTSDDNMYKNNAIETLVGALEQKPDVDMVYADYTNIDEEGHVLDEFISQEPQYLVACNVFGPCFLYTAGVAERVGGYDPGLFLAEDYDYWMRIYRYGKVIHLADNLYYYRRHEGSLSETRKTSISKQTYKALEKNFLPLYVDAKKNGLKYRFLDQVMYNAVELEDETRKMLISVDGGYGRLLSRRRMREMIIEMIQRTVIYRLYRKMKGTGC